MVYRSASGIDGQGLDLLGAAEIVPALFHHVITGLAAVDPSLTFDDYLPAPNNC